MFQISLNGVTYHLYRCLYSSDGTKITHQFKVKKGALSYEIGSSKVSITPFDGYWDIITFKEELKDSGISNQTKACLEDNLLRVIKELEPELKEKN